MIHVLHIFVPMFLTIAFVGGYFACKSSRKKPLNYRQLIAKCEENCDGKCYIDPYGIQTDELNSELDMEFDKNPYNIVFVDHFGDKHVITLAQVENDGVLTLYDTDVSKYDKNGKYKGEY